MKRFNKFLLIIFIAICVLLLIHHINVKLDVDTIPTKYIVSQVSEVKVEHLNFDENNSASMLPLITEEQKYSGNQSLKISSETEFINLFEYYLPEKNQNEYLNSVRLDLMIFAQSQFEEVVIVIEVSDFSGEMVQWKNVRITPTITNKWEHIYHSVYLNSEARIPQNKIKIYLWNVTKESFYVDDLRVAVRRSDTEPVSRAELPLKIFTQNFNVAQEDKTIYEDSLKTTEVTNYLHIASSDIFTTPFVVDFDSVSSNMLPQKINVSLIYKGINLHDNIKLAIEFRNKETQQKHFYYYQLPNYYQHQTQQCSFDVYIPEEYRFNGEMASYFWNIGGNEVNIEEIKYIYF